MSIWSNERTEIATWLSGYLNMVKTWVDKILDNEHYDVDKNKIIGLIDEWILWLEETKLNFTDDALNAIAKRAIDRKTGARGLRSILEEILLDTMFDLPGLDEVTEVVVNEEAVSSESNPLMIYAENQKEDQSA